jgi:regulator of cell morphogenesis and NO signaling
MSTIDVQITVGELVRQRPSRTRVLENLGIDYCCGGKKTLAGASREKGLDPATVAAVLAAAEQAGEPANNADPAKMTMTQLADHIEQTHHVYLKRELPRLVEISRKVASVHAGKSPTLKELAQVVDAMASEMTNHLAKEEEILFPALRELETVGHISHACFGTVANPIRMMEHEHDTVGEMLARIRQLTADYNTPEWGCNTYRAMTDGLRQFEADTHQHVHKENNILFPMAIEAEAKSAAVAAQR